MTLSLGGVRARFTSLQKLDLQATDAGLVHLVGLTGLTSLIVAEGQVTDAGLVHLKELASLEFLGLSLTQVTDTGVAELQKALPNCRIIKYPRRRCGSEKPRVLFSDCASK